ncbi:MAG: entericidin A/B family lipoprotein [Desulforhopalus sp.]
MRKILYTLIIFTMVSVLAGCNTMSGIGQDVEAAGDAVEESAEKNKTY